MTRKDFEMIAAAIRDAKRGMRSWDAVATRETARRIAEYISDGCIADNPRFDRRRFLKACGFDA